ncbi:chorismate--pyruvate lyase family protein [Pseudoalteromonas sp. T1lg65]|uniref:chorismate--pyruvate lyase family protein n=1 Tax=Pseudoalteromonas sp. T1lg65 TaxID=2077101 RepID=UPI003F7A2100
MSPQQLPLTLSWHNNSAAVKVSSAISPFIFESNSLTAKLKSHFEHFAVKVQFNQLCDTPEALLETFDNKPQIWCREVILYCNDKPFVFAQSWLNAEAQAEGIGQIGDMPLGELLFNDNSWRRGPLEFASIEVDNVSNDTQNQIRLAPQLKQLTSRRSWFKKAAAKILVCETFISEPNNAINC